MKDVLIPILLSFAGTLMTTMMGLLAWGLRTHMTALWDNTKAIERLTLQIDELFQKTEKMEREMDIIHQKVHDMMIIKGDL